MRCDWLEKHCTSIRQFWEDILFPGQAWALEYLVTSLRLKFKSQNSSSKNPYLKFGTWKLTVALIVCVSLQLHSQDFKKQFKRAKELFGDENYSAAMEAFRSLTIYDKANPYPEYASFYYALSAQKLGFNTIAKEMLLQTKNIYPEWDQLDEVNYWLYTIYLDQREYFHSLKLSREIKNNSLAKDIEAVKRTTLSKVDDI